MLKGAGLIDRERLRKDIARLDKTFTIDSEKFCGMTYRDPGTKLLTSIDIIDDSVVMLFTLPTVTHTNMLNARRVYAPWDAS